MECHSSYIGQHKNSGPLSDLKEEDKMRLKEQSSRLVPDFKARKFQSEARKHWDLFYKRNADRFFKDRHWTTREFEELASSAGCMASRRRVLLEVGCGAGNFVFPLLSEDEQDTGERRMFIYACDFSPRAVQLVKNNPNYDESRMKAFECDITAGDLDEKLREKMNIVSLVFVMSAIKPEAFAKTFESLSKVLSDEGILLFRDYAVNDMAMIRFAPGTKIAERHYLRQDGTTSYFFTAEEVQDLAAQAGFTTRRLEYVHRRTVNKKEHLDVDRTFLQGVFVKM